MTDQQLLQEYVETGSQEAFGEMSPRLIQPAIGHLQHAADIARLGFVEELSRFRHVGINSVVIAPQAAQRDQRIKEILRRAGMNSKLLRQLSPRAAARAPAQ